MLVRPGRLGRVGATLARVSLPVVPIGAFTVDPNPVAYAPDSGWTFIARRAPPFDAPAAATARLQASGVTAPAAVAAEFGGVFPTIAVNFAAGAETANFTVPANPLVLPE